MAHVLKTSALWAAVVVSGALLVGCGGGSSDEDTSADISASQRKDKVSPSNGKAVKQGKAVLSWSAPLTREDNTTSLDVGELDKYVIRYGQDEDNLTEQVVVEGAASLKGGEDSSFTINGLSQGTWYFTVQAQDLDGLVSRPSKMVSKNFSS